MKRTDIKVVKLPKLIKRGDGIALGLNEAEIQELNASSYRYGTDTAIPRLEDNIMIPFRNAFKDMVFDEALDIVGLDTEGILNSKHIKTREFDGKTFEGVVYPSLSHEYEEIVGNISRMLEGIRNGTSREGLVGLEGKPYIPLMSLIEHMERVKNSPIIRPGSMIINSTLRILKQDNTLNGMKM